MQLDSDIKLLKKEINELKKRERYYNLIIQNSIHSIVIIQNNKIIFANKNLINVFGYSLKELRDKTFMDFIYPEDISIVYNNYKDRVEGKDVPREYEFRAVNKTGAIIWVRISSFLIKWKGKPAVLSYFKNITDFKEKEKEEKKFKDLVENFPESIYETDLKGNIIYANKKAFEIFGYEPEDLIKGANVFQMIAPVDRERGMQMFQKRLMDNLPIEGVEYTAITKNGREFQIMLSGKVIFEDQKPIGIRGIIFDITYKKIQENLLKKQNDSIALINTINNAINEKQPLNIIYNILNSGIQDIFNLKHKLSIYLLKSDKQTLELYNNSNISKSIFTNTIISDTILSNNIKYIFDKDELKYYINHCCPIKNN